MIEKLELKNFQSHESSALEFHPGLNVIIGTSDSGKSAVLRSLYWAINNRPLGTSMVSHWNLDEKGSIIGQTFSAVQVNGKMVKRQKSKEANEYLVDGVSMEALGTEVPATIYDILNIQEVNVQKQMDAPFLLSESSGEVARFFNRTIKLDLIDKVLSLVEKEKREVKAKLQTVETEVAALEKKSATFEWLPAARTNLEKAQHIATKFESTQQSAAQLKIQVEKYRTTRETIQSFLWLASGDELVQAISSKNVSISDISKNISDISDRTAAYSSHQKTLEKLTFLNAAPEIITKISSLQKQIAEAADSVDSLDDSISGFQSTRKKIQELIESIAEAEKELPKSCPLCGSALRSEDEIHSHS